MKREEIESKIKHFSKQKQDLELEKAREEERLRQATANKAEALKAIRQMQPDFDEHADLSDMIRKLEEEIKVEIKAIDDLLMS